MQCSKRQSPFSDLHPNLNPYWGVGSEAEPYMGWASCIRQAPQRARAYHTQCYGCQLVNVPIWVCHQLQIFPPERSYGAKSRCFQLANFVHNFFGSRVRSRLLAIPPCCLGERFGASTSSGNHFSRMCIGRSKGPSVENP